MSREATRRLSLDDPWRLSFEAWVIAHAEHQGRPSLVRDESAFCPEGGGQMADRGIVGGLGVVDVQVGCAGRRAPHRRGRGAP